MSQPVKTRPSNSARGTKSSINGVLPSVRFPSCIVPICESDPMGLASPWRTASTPAMSVVATAPMPGIITPSFPFLAQACQPEPFLYHKHCLWTFLSGPFIGSWFCFQSRIHALGRYRRKTDGGRYFVQGVTKRFTDLSFTRFDSGEALSIQSSSSPEQYDILYAKDRIFQLTGAHHA